MKRYLGISFACFCSLLLVAGLASARPAKQLQELSAPETDVDLVGDVDGTNPAPQKVLQDTIWIADWSFDGGAPCTSTGWLHADNHILRDASQYWYISGSYTGVRFITGNAAVLGYVNNNCCEDLNGYDNDWYYGIRIPYAGAATISFNFLVDSEAGFDFLQVESDSACASFDRVNYVSAPQNNAAFYRKVNTSFSGLNNAAGTAQVINQALSNYGSGTSCCWISFTADGGYSPCDGNNATSIGAGAVVDQISITDANGTRTEDFTDGVLSNGWTFVNMADNKPFGIWARVFQHITDNDLCTENTTCAYLFTDDTNPTIANDPSMAFGPGGFVIKNWLDDTVIGPWASLASTPTAKGTVLAFRRFAGNFFTTGRIVQNWSVRAKVTCGAGLSGWGHASQWNSLSNFSWLSSLFSMTPNFDPTATDLQIRFRTSDWQFIAGAAPPSPFIPGPGPFGGDRVRIGRQVLSGPVINEGIDSRSQGQDCFATEIDPNITPAGEHYRPTTDRFGTCAFSQGTELTINKTGPNLVTGDSVQVQVLDSRGAGGITAVQWYGAIVSGPHAGKAPAPYTVGGNGFFATNADSCRTAGGLAIANRYFRDLDDTYFRGGDVLYYFWAATDATGGFSSDPVGLTAAPANVAAAQAATGGMLETSFLPKINWAAAYLARIAADPNGDLTPTAGELAASTQANGILYVNHIVTRRRSGDVNRTSFMYTLDNLGYRGFYDVYDHQGMGNTNNHLGGRATIQQAQGYNLIVYDVGNGTPGRPIMPNGVDLDAEKIDQATWFRNWLAQAALPGVDFATLWLVGSNVVEEHSTNALYTSNCGLTLAATNQGLNVNPDCVGQGSFTFDNGAGTSPVSFTTGSRASFSLNGGCPVLKNYDALNASAATSVRVYRYREPIFGVSGGTLGGGAVVMNTNAAEDWNTITMSFPWFDIRDPFDSTPGKPGSIATPPALPPPARDVLNAILNGTLPLAHRHGTNPTDVPGDPSLDVVKRTMLHQNIPNPFNPMTKISFDLAQNGHVKLRIFDVAGRTVRTLLDKEMQAGRSQNVVWNGLDDTGRRVSTGVYFYRLDAVDVTITKKMVMMK